ncbi:MAG: hypothetical protein Q9202_007562 [Teloschistes flavicans]
MSNPSPVQYNHLVTVSGYSGVSRSASIIEEPDPTSCNLIAFLTAVQWREIDILPITWQPALDTAGKGATAEIQQSLVSLAFTFAFKRFLTSPDEEETSRYYRAIISELCILGHPAIKQHPNIVELQGICWDVISEDQVWPVLVFPKAKFGNMLEFFDSDEGARLTADQCFYLIAGCIQAVVSMHTLGIVHGDIKPENILVVEDQVHGYSANLCDFGFSTIHAGGRLIQLPYSWPWTAPEYHRRGFSLDYAKKTDIYSLGLLVSSHAIVRKIIVRRLEEYAISSSPTTSRDQAGIQLAICFAIGFGIERDVQRSSDIVKRFGGSYEAVMADLAPLQRRESWEYHNPKIQQMAATGLLREMDYVHEYRKLLTVEAVEKIGWRELTDMKQVFRTTHPIIYSLNMQYMHNLKSVGKLGDAQALLDQFVVDYGNDSEAPMHSLNLLAAREAQASIARHQGDYILAQRLATPLLENAKAILGPLHLLTCSFRNSLACIHMATGAYDHAVDLFREALEITTAEYGPDHPETLAISGNLAKVLQRQGELGAAEDAATQVYESSTKMFDAFHPMTLASASNLASIHQSRGKYDLAQTLLEKSLDLYEKHYGAMNPSTLRTLNSLAIVRMKRGHLDAAEKDLRRVIHGQEALYGRVHVETQSSVNSLAGLLMQRHDFQSGELLYREVLDNTRQSLGEDHLETVTATSNLAFACQMQHDHIEAKGLYEWAYARTKKHLGEQHPRALKILSNIAGVLYNQGKLNEAEQAYRRLLQNRQESLSPHHPDVFNTMSNLAAVLMDQGRLEESEALNRDALNAKLQQFGRDHPSVLRTVNNMSTLLLMRGNYEGAEELALWAMEGRKSALGPNHPETLSSIMVLGQIRRARESGVDVTSLLEM